MKTFTARMRIEYTCNVTVDAKDEAEAREKLKRGEWNDDVQLDEPVNWEDPTNLQDDT